MSPIKSLRPKYITDSSGKKISVILPLKDFRDILEDLEELEDIQAYDAAKSLNEPSLSVDEAFKKIESKRKSK